MKDTHIDDPIPGYNANGCLINSSDYEAHLLLRFTPTFVTTHYAIMAKVSGVVSGRIKIKDVFSLKLMHVDPCYFTPTSPKPRAHDPTL